jgi:hypothetical protein
LGRRCDTFADIVWPWSVGYFADLKTVLPYSFLIMIASRVCLT